MMSETARRVIICTKLERRTLPIVAALHLEGGYGDGRACCGCGERITSAQAGYELDFAPEIHPGSIFLHRSCFQTWQEECRRISG